MSKVKTPLLGLSAQGSIGKKVTFADVKGLHIAKRFPTHIDAHTGAQVAHRRRFTNARYYWYALTQSQRNAYETAARPLRMTGWASFLRHYLATDPNQVLWAPLDAGEGSTAYDLSGRDNHGTIYGASWATGKIFNSLSFDGIDDYVDCGKDSSFDITDAITLSFWLNPSAYCLSRNYGYFLEKSANLYAAWKTYKRIRFWIKGSHLTTPAEVLTADEWQHFACIFDKDGLPGTTHTAKIYRNCVEVATGTLVGPIPTTAAHVYIGRAPPSDAGTFLIDEARIFNRALSGAEIKLLALKDLT